ncbi:hypothetical protein HPB48_024646 [Haemaphysalis longicornis]|uniref:Sof1-like protein domain-containing protein n=1 Tax=Haemaphysalis longicornis TaxID=44386 RepID=A0A9J6H829_HAELO|nr:hypothetical protein HPB48_024646 [Haemaphysalis longicornis]
MAAGWRVAWVMTRTSRRGGQSHQRGGEPDEPVNTIITRGVLTGIAHHLQEPLFATCGESVHLWEHQRSEPLRTLNWGVDTVYAIRFNPIQVCILGLVLAQDFLCIKRKSPARTGRFKFDRKLIAKAGFSANGSAEERTHSRFGHGMFRWPGEMPTRCRGRVGLGKREQDSIPAVAMTAHFSLPDDGIAQTNVMASASSDRSIVLYDTRESQPLRRVVLEMRSNAVCWNPMEAFLFTCANEDYNLYTFDMRKLKSAVNVHIDHVSAVMDVDYSPTGKELVSGSYDKTVRIFTTDHGRSREVYHTKRMQRLSCVLWSLDNRYIITGSDEMNIRLWKAYASQKLGTLGHRERMAFQYQEKLKERFGQHPQVRRISRHRHVPKHIYNAQREKHAMVVSRKRKYAPLPQLLLGLHLLFCLSCQGWCSPTSPDHMCIAPVCLKIGFLALVLGSRWSSFSCQTTKQGGDSSSLAVLGREANRRAHSRPGTVPFKAERSKHVVSEEQ